MSTKFDRMLKLLALLVGWVPVLEVPGQPAPVNSPIIEAEIRLERRVVQAGAPVWVRLALTNMTQDPVPLNVPGVDQLNLKPEAQPGQVKLVGAMGLPLAHVFSGTGFTALNIESDRGQELDSRIALPPRESVPQIVLEPHGSVGMRMELTQYYDSLLRPGIYKLTWNAYAGTVQSAAVELTVLAERQAVMITDFGRLIIRFYYEQAPNHVQNFIELVEQRFYDNLTFHRVIPGALVQGGDPRGDGRGMRADGKRLKAEFNSIPFDLGTVGMARSPRDPDSASSQFFICLGRQPLFDGNQTAFGYLVGNESFETMRRIQAVPTGPGDRPLKPVFIRAVSLENVPPPHLDRKDAPALSSGSTHVGLDPVGSANGGRLPSSSVGPAEIKPDDDDLNAWSLSAVLKPSSRPAEDDQSSP